MNTIIKCNIENNLTEIAEGLHIGYIDLIINKDFIDFIFKNDIRAIYIAPANRFHGYEWILKSAGFENVYPFLGGFMDRSILLFCLGTDEEKKYYTRITGLSFLRPLLPVNKSTN
jgi:hypothetical protein